MSAWIELCKKCGKHFWTRNLLQRGMCDDCWKVEDI